MLNNMNGMRNIIDGMARLQAMDRAIKEISDEEYFFCWIYIFPDEASESDIFDIATDESLYTDCSDEFNLLMSDLRDEDYEEYTHILDVYYASIDYIKGNV